MADNKNLEKKEVAKKEKKDGLGKKIAKFFREYKSELKKISWPTLPEVIKNSLVTIVVVLIVGLFIWVVDTGLTFGRDALLDIKSNASTVDTNDSDDTMSTEDYLKILETYALETVAMSASDVVSGADASASDVYVITSGGQLIDGYEKYIAATEADAANMLLNYAATLELPTVTSDSDVSAADLSASDAE